MRVMRSVAAIIVIGLTAHIVIEFQIHNRFDNFAGTGYYSIAALE